MIFTGASGEPLLRALILCFQYCFLFFCERCGLSTIRKEPPATSDHCYNDYDKNYTYFLHKWAYVYCKKSTSSVSSCALERNPCNTFLTSPSWNTISVGIDIIWYFIGIVWFSSVLSLATSILSAWSSANCSTCGAIATHGGHQLAQKSNEDGLVAF